MFKSLTPLDKASVDEIVADQRFRRAKIDSLNEPKLASALVNAKQRGNVSFYSNVSHREEIAGFSPVALPMMRRPSA